MAETAKSTTHPFPATPAVEPLDGEKRVIVRGVEEFAETTGLTSSSKPLQIEARTVDTIFD